MKSSEYEVSVRQRTKGNPQRKCAAAPRPYHYKPQLEACKHIRQHNRVT